MAFPSVRFVESPNDAAAVRLDLNDVGASVDVASLHDGFDLGMPALAGDAGRRGRRWGLRSLPLPLLLSGGRGAARAAMTKLAREATRDGWLRWQLDASSPPVWFRTYASTPSAAGFDYLRTASTRDRWATALNMDADPFGVGAPVTLGPYTVTNSPLTGANPTQVTLPDVLGEMPAPAVVKLTKAATGGMLGPACAVLPSPSVTVQGASWTTAMTASTDNSDYVGGKARSTNANVTAAGWTSLATFTPSAALPAGRRRALLHVSATSNVGALLLRWVASSPSAVTQVATAPVLVRAAVNSLRWVDTGVLPYPLADGAALGVTPTTVYTLQARRAAPGGDLTFGDRMQLLAVDDATLQVASPENVGTAATTVIIDAEQRAALMAVGGNVAKAPATRGGWPTLRPGQTNVLWVAQNLDPLLVSDRNDQLASTLEVTATYRPRYLWGIG